MLPDGKSILRSRAKLMLFAVEQAGMGTLMLLAGEINEICFYPPFFFFLAMGEFCFLFSFSLFFF